MNNLWPDLRLIHSWRSIDDVRFGVQAKSVIFNFHSRPTAKKKCPILVIVCSVHIYNSVHI